MGKWVHSLDAHDFDQRTAYCFGCERRVEIQQTKKGWTCRPGRLHAKADYRARAAVRIKEANRSYREAHPDRYIQSTYGLTAADHRRMLVTQAGRCAICAEPRDEMFVDHDHATGAVRGLLCRACNTGLGWFSDDVERLARAIDYLAAARSTAEGPTDALALI